MLCVPPHYGVRRMEGLLRGEIQSGTISHYARIDRESRCRSHENAGHLDHIHVDHDVGGGTSKVKGRRTDELLRLHGKSDQDSPL